MTYHDPEHLACISAASEWDGGHGTESWQRDQAKRATRWDREQWLFPRPFDPHDPQYADYRRAC